MKHIITFILFALFTLTAHADYRRVSTAQIVKKIEVFKDGDKGEKFTCKFKTDSVYDKESKEHTEALNNGVAASRHGYMTVNGTRVEWSGPNSAEFSPKRRIKWVCSIAMGKDGKPRLVLHSTERD